MAGLRGNVAWLGAAFQADADPATFVAANGHKNGLVGGNIGPVRETDNLSETDASRDRGITYVTQSGVEGEPEIYVRDESIVFWLKAALGNHSPSAGPTNFTHTIIPGNTLPPFTCWKNLGDLLYEQYTNCKASSITISAEQGQPLTATVGIQGSKATRLTVAPDNAAALPVENSTPYYYQRSTGAGIVTLGGGATALVRSFELGIENNVTRQHTNDVTAYDVVEGVR